MNKALFSPLNITLALAVILVAAAGFILVPMGTLLPIHWGPTGQPDSFWPRDAALLIAPAVVLGLSCVFFLLGRVAPQAQIEASKHAWRTVIPTLTAMMLVMQSGIVLVGLGYPDQMVRMICLALGVMLILFGNVMPKMQPNRLAGVHLPWLQEPSVWRATQRTGGYCFIAGGVLLLAGALATANPLALLVLMLSSLAVPLIVTTIYSYRLVQRAQ